MVLLAVVVVGKVTPITVYVPSQVKALPVPLSNNLNINLSPFVGVPVGALIVNADANIFLDKMSIPRCQYQNVLGQIAS